MTEKSFYQTEKALWEAKCYYSPLTGEATPMTIAQKVVYMYMLDRVVFFVEKLKSPHFESQETIASKLNLEKKAVGKILRGFIETGVLKGEKKKPDGGGQIQWFYNWVCKDLLFDSTKKSSTVGIEMKNLKQSNLEYDDDLPEWAK